MSTKTKKSKAKTSKTKARKTTKSGPKPRHKAVPPTVSKIVDAKSFTAGRRGGHGVYTGLFEQAVKLAINKGITVAVDKGDEPRLVSARLLAALRRFPARTGKGYRLRIVVGVDDCAGQVAVFKSAVK